MEMQRLFVIFVQQDKKTKYGFSRGLMIDHSSKTFQKGEYSQTMVGLTPWNLDVWNCLSSLHLCHSLGFFKVPVSLLGGSFKNCLIFTPGKMIQVD